MSTMENAASMLERIGSGVLPAPGEASRMASELRALAAQGGEHARHCQTGHADVCLAAQRDGVVCPADSCDIDDGGRVDHTKAAPPSQPVTDEAIEQSLRTPMGLDHTLRDLIRGDTASVGYSKPDVVRALLAALPSQPVALPDGLAIRAKPLEWEEVAQFNTTRDKEWTDKRMGFHIAYDPDDDTDSRYSAAWGEGETEFFATLEDAKEWCQSEVDDWIRKNATVAAAPAGEGVQS